MSGDRFRLPPWSWLAPALVALLAGWLTWLAYRLPPFVSDFDQFWLMGRAIMHGRNPYAEWWLWPSPYPLTAPVLTLPLAILPIGAARVLFAMVSAGVFTIACQRTQRPLWVSMLSASFMQGITIGQWSPLMTAAVVLPLAQVTWAAKPTVGFALFTGWPGWHAVAGGVALLALSLGLAPHWPLGFLDNLRTLLHRAPITRPGGFLLLAAFLRWRHPEGRMLGTLALVPHSTASFELLPLFLCCRTRWQGYSLAALTYAAAFLTDWSMPPDLDLRGQLDHRWFPMLFLGYLPALAMVLRPGEAAGGEVRDPEV